MEKAPQIVSRRLRAAASAVDHPDPEVLTAFSEHSLRKSERAAVVEHLARCGECREIVALALPAAEPTQETVRPAGEGWLTGPVLRWGFIAAGIVAIASFGITRYPRHASMMGEGTAPPQAITKEAKNLPASPTSPGLGGNSDKAAAVPTSTPANQKTLGSSNTVAGPSAEMATPALGGPVQSKGGGALGGTLPRGPRVPWQSNTKVQPPPAQSPANQWRGTPVPSAPPSAQPESVEVQSAEAVLSATADNPTVQDLQHRRLEARVERSKPATTVANAAQPMAAFPPPNSPAKAQRVRQSAQAAAVPNASILWTISAAGRLQRSLDQGTTWQDIDINNSSAGAGLDLMSAPSKLKEADANRLAKKDALAPITFRAVAANGPDVWAGAAGGLLYHSTDAGAHWTYVVPSASGVSLTGDIVSLEFVDLQHGRATTSTTEVWTTSDAGQSWQKQ